MILQLQVKTTEREYEVSTSLKTIVLWERKFKRKASEMATAVGLEDLAFMAFEASKANNITVPVEFDNFLEKLVSVTIVEGDQPSFTHPVLTDIS